MVKIDINKTGLEMLFKPWQIPIVELLMEDRYTIANPLRSREAWIYINDLLPEGQTISRASVIFFLQDLAEAGWLKSGTRTGKGGHHEVYWKRADLSVIIIDLVETLSVKLQDAIGQYQSLKGSTNNEV